MTKIKKITRIDDVEQKCILVSAKDHLYVTDDEIVTHNTIVCGTMTELGFWREAGKSDDEIMRFFNDLKGRVESRMKGNFLGRTILDSSPNDLDSPVDQYCLNEARKNPKNYVISGSRWDWVPEDFKDIDNRFPVFKGSNGKPPQILSSAEGYSPTEIIYVPVEMYQLFHDDLNKSLKDLAGIPSGNQDKLFYDYDKIEQCFIPELKNVYSCIKADSRMPPSRLIWDQVYKQFFTYMNGRYNFYYKPNLPRVFHIDQSTAGDMSCISICHVERKFERSDDISKDLVYIIDMTIPIHPYGGRINQDAIREFIMDLVTIGNMSFVFGSYDQFQSDAARDGLQRFGIDMERVSVDIEMDPYLFLAQCIEQGNLKIGRNIFFKNNLKSLSIVPRKGTKSLKADHSYGDVVPPNGADEKWETSLLGFNAKDISDAVCGSVYNAKMHLALDIPSLGEKFDEHTIVLSPTQIRQSTTDLIKGLGLSL